MRNHPINVLLIEDDKGDAKLIQHVLRHCSIEFHVEWVTSLGAAAEKMSAEHFDVILSDLHLPDGEGTETVSRIRNAQPDTPIIVLTGLDDNVVALELLDTGAQDYVVKNDLTAEDLDRTIRHAIQRQQHLLKIRELLYELQVKGELLERKNKKLEQLYRQAHEFVDNVSHEFRTPLTVIKEYVSLIHDGVVTDWSEQQTLLRIVEDRADDLNIMVDDMLDVSKLEAGMLGAWRRNCHVTEIVKSVSPSIQRKANVKNTRLEWNIDEDLPEVYCDAEKVGRVITNLAINAIKFCGDPGSVCISAHADMASHEVVFAIRDNGPGIDASQQASIFKRFKQLDVDTRVSTKGFGLGLNIAKDLVDLNFGELQIQSDLGRGSTFSFSIPMWIPAEIVRRYVERIQQLEEQLPQLSVIIATVDEKVACEDIEGIDGLLNCCLRKNDLLLRLEPARWLIVIPEPECEVSKYRDRIQQELMDENRNRPLGHLPELSIERNGTWPLKKAAEEINRYIESTIQSNEGITC